MTHAFIPNTWEAKAGGLQCIHSKTWGGTEINKAVGEWDSGETFGRGGQQGPKDSHWVLRVLRSVHHGEVGWG